MRPDNGQIIQKPFAYWDDYHQSFVQVRYNNSRFFSVIVFHLKLDIIKFFSTC